MRLPWPLGPSLPNPTEFSISAQIPNPRHSARFDVRTGKVLAFPAVVDVPADPVKVEGDTVLV
jgi:nitrite reductase/ring-hydroxylating ferredoxin subunit